MLAACIDSPSFESQRGADASGASSSPAATADMVLVPAVVLAHGSVSPTARPADDKGKGKGKGKDKDDDDEPSSDGGSGSTGSAPRDAGVDAAPPASSPPSAEPFTVAAFWLDAREVTIASFRRCVDAGACPRVVVADVEACMMQSTSERSPIACVTQAQARAFCAWQGKRLPTSGEWTAAAAGSARRVYPWGDAPPDPARLNACGVECAAGKPPMFAGSDGERGAAPVGSFPSGASPDGALDLAGNVAEWIESSAGIVRGGSFEDFDVTAVSSLSERVVDPSQALPTVGFRCARSER
ncbi:MAG: SUMF1/EgtB/PvdO family nonheme iron enzyme [Deltaproteobacteria bacterium]|nr:SUMF1/EgtB/PvdO family nonheme iron enzyme [Deltaproteobacteria bacterium]